MLYFLKKSTLKTKNSLILVKSLQYLFENRSHNNMATKCQKEQNFSQLMIFKIYKSINRIRLHTIFVKNIKIGIDEIVQQMFLIYEFYQLSLVVQKILIFDWFIQLKDMFIDLNSQIFTKLILQIRQNSNKLIEYFIDKSLEEKKDKQNLHFNNQFLNFSNVLTQQKNQDHIPLSTKDFRIIQHQQIKRFQEIILPGSLIGHFSNFSSKQFFRTAFLMEIGEGTELWRLNNLRNFCLDGVVIQEWDINLLLSLADAQQHFYFLIRGDKQLLFFLYFWQRIFQEKFKNKTEGSRKTNSLQINIFHTQNQKFFVNLQMFSSPEQQLLIHENDIGFQCMPIECFYSQLPLDKTLQTSVQQGLNRADIAGHENQLQIYSIKSPLLPFSNHTYDDWIIDTQLFSEPKDNKECQASISSEYQNIQLDSFGQDCQKEQWILHRIDIYNDIDGEDSRQIVFSVNQFQKRYAKSVCSYQELQLMKKSLSEFLQQEQEESNF